MGFYNRTDINRMPLGRIQSELASLEAIPIKERTVETVQRIGDLRRAEQQISRGSLW